MNDNLNWALVEDTIELPIQVNGKRRAVITVASQATREQIEEMALANDKVSQFLEGKTVKKIIVVPGKIVNIAVA